MLPLTHSFIAQCYHAHPTKLPIGDCSALSLTDSPVVDVPDRAIAAQADGIVSSCVAMSLV